MRRKLQRVGALTLGQGWQLAQAWLWLLGVDLALRLMPLPKIQTLLLRPVPPAGVAGALHEVQGWLRAVDVAARHHLYPMRCLQRSLALQLLLSRRGQPFELRIGVRREAEELHAHAWLERAGRPLTDPAEVGHVFTPLEASGARR